MGNTNEIDKQLLTPPEDRYKVPENIDLSKIQTMIKSKKLAPFHRPHDESIENGEKCPICFMYYIGGLNICNNCHCSLCTECFLRCNTFRRHHSNDWRISRCPFCKTKPFNVVFHGPRTKKELDDEFIEEQRVIQLKIQQRNTLLEEEKKKREKELENNNNQNNENSNGVLVFEMNNDTETNTSQKINENPVNSSDANVVTELLKNIEDGNYNAGEESENDVEKMEDMMLRLAIEKSLSEV